MSAQLRRFTLHRPWSLLLVGLLALTVGVTACDSSGSNEEEGQMDDGPPTFTVTTAQKTSAHPYSGQGFDVGYVVDGEQGKTLTLERGQTYEFQMDGVPEVHPFYIATSEEGQGQGEYSNGVENNGASGNETLTFTPPSGAPDVLYYNCVNHAFMGGQINITDAGSGGSDPDY